MADDLERAAVLLKTNEGGRSLYDHLTDVLLHIVKEQPTDVLASFESLSVQIKNATLVPKQYKELPAIPQEPEEKKQLLAALDRTAALCQIVEDDDNREPAAIPDLMAQAGMFEWAGVNLGKEELYKLSLAIQQLATELDLQQVRFFGKFFGTQRDYYVVEAKMNDDDDDQLPDGKEPDPKRELPGTGANSSVYYVTNSPGGKWSRLPTVTPDQIVTARNMRRLLTGNLNAPVLGFPRFPWGEASYLRALIARISAATIVSPKGFYMRDDQGDEHAILEDEDFHGLAPGALLDPENWVHHRPCLLRSGRTMPEPEDEEAEQDEEEAGERAEREEPVEILLPLASDESALIASWKFRSGSNPAHTHAVVSAHSLLWPGAVTVCKGLQFESVYVGWGQKYLFHSYTPPPPPPVQSEYVAEFNPEDGEEDPLTEQIDPLPSADIPDDEDEGDEDEELDGEVSEEEESDEEQ